MIRFFVTSEYEMLKYEGESTCDIERGIKKFKEYRLEDSMTDEDIKGIMEFNNFDKLMKKIMEYFEIEYGYIDCKQEIHNNYQYSVSSYIWLGDGEEEKHFIHIDELFESAILSFFMVVFKWAKEFENVEENKFYFQYLLFLMNEVSISGILPDDNAQKVLFDKIKSDKQILNLAADCYWAVVIFTVAHEIAHGYLKNKMGIKAETSSEYREEEIQADKIAYDIFLQIICDDKGEKLVEEYTYLVPIMYMDYFDLLYYTDRVLHKSKITDDTHPLPERRKNILFSIPYGDKYDFETELGNNLYNNFLDVLDEFKQQLLIKKDLGKLGSM